MLRAVAALAVVVHHSFEMSKGAQGPHVVPHWLTLCGAAGVDIFFVISGFIMTYVSFSAGRRPERPVRFLARRVMRIYPLYWICSTLVLLIVGAGFLRNQDFDFMTAINSYTLLPGPKLLLMAWTLSYEMYFYIIFAACLLLANLYTSLLTAISVIVAGIVLGVALPPSTFSEFIGNPIVLEFCYGMVLALFALRARLRVPTAFSIPGFALLAVAPTFVPDPTADGLTRAVVWGLPATLIVAAFLPIGPPRSALSRTAVSWGDASYSLYLTHAFVMIAYGWLIKWTFIGQLPQVAVIPAVVAASLAVGVASHVILERPLLKLGRRLTGRQSEMGRYASPATGEGGAEMRAPYGQQAWMRSTFR
ncbi:acyltransferase [Chelatococcus reniformis]|uniref:Acyltransferase n=2 Tax=Chelatococcus reniformis TaxID=1494448 RepID=A0A916XG72_9HYPH|nr:acyltransferase [Chelatococcus reniformis]